MIIILLCLVLLLWNSMSWENFRGKLDSWSEELIRSRDPTKEELWHQTKFAANVWECASHIKTVPKTDVCR